MMVRLAMKEESRNKYKHTMPVLYDKKKAEEKSVANEKEGPKKTNSL